MARFKFVKRTPATMGSWKTVAAPTGWTWSLPFAIQRQGRKFRPAPSFSLYDYAIGQIAAGTTYYVSKTGLDTNTGLSWAQALKNVYTAKAKADARIIYIGAGYYYRNESGAGVTPSRSMALIGVGDVYLTSDCRNQADPAVLVGNHYEIPLTRTVRQVRDAATLNSYGGDTRYALQANSAGVDATVGSWYWAANVLYIRTLDDRAPDSNLRYYELDPPFDLYNSGAVYDRVYYLENIKLRGGTGVCIVYTASGGDLRMYMQNCDLRYAHNGTSTYNAFSVWGATEAMFFNVKLAHSPSYDGFNYKLSGGITPRAVEYNCESWDHGDGSVDQPSTSHDGCTIVRIMGKYHDCTGTTILPDIGAGGKTWCLGTIAYSPKVPATGGAFYVDTGASMWLDRVTTASLGASAKGVYVADATSAIRYKDIATAGTLSNNGGTLETY